MLAFSYGFAHHDFSAGLQKEIDGVVSCSLARLRGYNCRAECI